MGLLQRVNRLATSLGGRICPECGGGGRGPVKVEMHIPLYGKNECSTCDGSCRDSGPEFCNSCGRVLRFTIKFDNPNGQDDEDGV